MMNVGEDGALTPMPSAKCLFLAPKRVWYIDGNELTAYIDKHPGCEQTAIEKAVLLGVEFVPSTTGKNGDCGWVETRYHGRTSMERMSMARAAVEWCLIYGVLT